MKREELKKWMPILIDFVDGAVLQLSSDGINWIDADETLQEFNIAYLTNCVPYKNIRVKEYNNSNCFYNKYGGCPRADVEFGTPCEHKESRNSFCKYYTEKKVILPCQN